jgi:hypothetical protein
VENRYRSFGKPENAANRSIYSLPRVIERQAQKQFVTLSWRKDGESRPRIDRHPAAPLAFKQA